MLQCFTGNFRQAQTLKLSAVRSQYFFLQTVEPFYVPYTSQGFFSKKILPQKIFLKSKL